MSASQPAACAICGGATFTDSRGLVRCMSFAPDGVKSGDDLRPPAPVFDAEYDRLRAENERLRTALDEIVDDLSVPNRPAPWAAHALQVAQGALNENGAS